MPDRDFRQIEFTVGGNGNNISHLIRASPSIERTTFRQSAVRTSASVSFPPGKAPSGAAGPSGRMYYWR
jgi:hypothetical protein